MQLMVSFLIPPFDFLDVPPHSLFLPSPFPLSLLGLSGMFASKVVVLSALMAAVGGLTFGYDQGVVSITLVMEQFLKEIPKVDDDADSSASFNRGLMTAILQLGAMIGAASSGYVADKWSRRVAIRIGVVWFVIGSAIQTGEFREEVERSSFTSNVVVVSLTLQSHPLVTLSHARCHQLRHVGRREIDRWCWNRNVEYDCTTLHW